MKKIITKYNGAILLYSVLIIGVFAMNARCKYLNEVEKTEIKSAIATKVGE